MALGVKKNQPEYSADENVDDEQYQERNRERWKHHADEEKRKDYRAGVFQENFYRKRQVRVHYEQSKHR